jgi:hypothetical protein
MQKDVLEMAVAKHAGGRPTIYGTDHPCWMAMCEDISQGKSLSTSLKADGMPSYVVVMERIKKDVAFRAMYEKAIEDRADRLAEEILELADEAIPAHLDGPSKSAWVNQKRIQVDARKWVAAKLKPKVYGDRIDVSVTDTRISVSDALKEAKQRVLTDERDIVDVVAKDVVSKE